MSIASAKSFIERINTDAEFANRAMEQQSKEKFDEFIKVPT